MDLPDQQPSVEWVVLAHTLRPQGRKGELLAELLTDFPERFGDRPRVHLAPSGFTGKAGEAREITVKDFWLPVGKNAGRVVLHFDDIDSINAAESLAGLDVIIPSEQRVPLDADSHYIDDLNGCVVWHGEQRVGVVEGIDFTTTPDGARRLEEAAPLLRLRSETGTEILIPFVKHFLLSLDVQAKRIEMQLPEGLIDLNS